MIRRLPPVPALVIISVFVPEAFGFFLGGFRLTVSRLVLLGLAPVMVLAFPRLIASGRYRFVLADALMPLLGLWMILAPAQIEGLDVGLKSGGIEALTFVGPYLLMRCTLGSTDDLHAITRLFCIAAAIAGPLALADTLTQSPFWREELARLTGYTYFHPTRVFGEDHYRLGLYRAQGIFEHPIMLGIIMCYALLLSRDVVGWARWCCRAGSGIGLFLCLSAGPWNVFVMGLGLTLYSRVFRFPHRWLPVLVAAAFMLATVFLVSQNPLGWVFNHLTFDPATGYFRLLTWQYAGDDVMASPIFGIGVGDNWFRPSWMPSTVDSLWLKTAMTYGIPGSLLLAMAVAGAASLPGMPGARDTGFGEREMRLSETLGIILLLTVIIGFANDFWGATEATVSVVMGMRAVCGQSAAEAVRLPARQLQRASAIS